MITLRHTVEGIGSAMEEWMTQRGIKVSLLAALLGVSLPFVAGCSSSTVDTTERDDEGEITEAGDLGAFRLTVGDCIYDPDVLTTTVTDESEEVAQFEGVPCSQPHTGEVVLVDDDFFADEADFPGDQALASRADEPCLAALEDYTAQPFDSSPYAYYQLFPTQESWQGMGDRGIACVGIVLSEETWEPIESAGSIRATA